MEIVNEELPPKESRDLSAVSVAKVPLDRKLGLNDLRVLSLLYGRPMTVYSLRRELIHSFGVKTSFGTLYPQLRLFEDLKIVIGTWDQRKHTYCLTQTGMIEVINGVRSLLDTGNLMHSMIHTARELSPMTFPF
jgi:DNA-binding PadR family transcriptional regulator